MMEEEEEIEDIEISIIIKAITMSTMIEEDMIEDISQQIIIQI